MNPYFTPTSFDSDNSDPAMYNMNQPYMPGWDYPNQYDPYPQHNDYNFQNNFNSSQSSWGFTYPESNFQPPCPQVPQYSFPNFDSYTPFPEPPIEEKSSLERSMEESLERMQNLLNSQIFPHQTPHPPFLENPIEEESELEKRFEDFCDRMQNMLDSSSQPNFQESYSSFPVSSLQNEQTSTLELSMEPLREFEQQPQNPMDSQFHHNFQNQLPYSDFQEPITKSMEDMIPNPNPVTQPISRLDSILSELINESEESLSSQPLTDSYIPNSTDWTHESCHFGNSASISEHTFELDQSPSYESHLDMLASYPFLEIELHHECDPEPHVSDSISLFDSIMTPVSLPDFFSISESTLNPAPVHREMESPISYDHTSLMGKVCEYQFFGLDPVFEPISTLIVDSRLDLSQLPESVSVFVPDPLESKSIIFQNHTSLLDKNVDKNDSVIIFENLKLDGDNFFNKTIQSIIHFWGHIRGVIGGFLQDPQYLDWVATLGPIRPPPESPP